MYTSETIEWHEECYKNQKYHLFVQESKVADDIKSLNIRRHEVEFYRYQIDEAKKEGRTKFDREKFRRKKIGE